MTIIRCNPGQRSVETGKNLNRMLNSFLTGRHFAHGVNGVFTPRVDILENDDNFVLAVELPGMEKEEIKVAVEDGILTISGEKKSPTRKENTSILHSELINGKFSRSFTLPDNIKSGGIGADYKKGILMVTMPKAEKARTREIEVNVN